MKALYIFNPNSTNEVNLIERAKSEMSGYITAISIDEVSQELKSLVRATPALIIITDDLQGEELTKEGVNGELLATAMLYKRLEEEEKCLYYCETNRLDILINAEKATIEHEADVLFSDLAKVKGWII